MCDAGAAHGGAFQGRERARGQKGIQHAADHAGGSREEIEDQKAREGSDQHLPEDQTARAGDPGESAPGKAGEQGGQQRAKPQSKAEPAQQAEPVSARGGVAGASAERQRDPGEEIVRIESGGRDAEGSQREGKGGQRGESPGGPEEEKAQNGRKPQGLVLCLSLQFDHKSTSWAQYIREGDRILSMRGKILKKC